MRADSLIATTSPSTNRPSGNLSRSKKRNQAHGKELHNPGRCLRTCLPRSGRYILRSVCGTNSVVECDLAKVEVASSNLVSRFFPQFTKADASVSTSSRRVSNGVVSHHV